jgi:hypothetical protein
LKCTACTARDARLHVHALHGFKAAGEFVPQRHVLLQDLAAETGTAGAGLRSRRFRVRCLQAQHGGGRGDHGSGDAGGSPAAVGELECSFMAMSLFKG